MTHTPDRTLVQAQFGANAAKYSTSTVHAKGASLQRVVELVAPAQSWTVLDIATGAGHMALAFAPHVAAVTASDVTAEMLAEVQKNAAKAGLANVTTAHADAEALPFADGAFDLVTCRIAPHHFPDQPRFVREVARVLRPGGVFALVDNVAPDAAHYSSFDVGAVTAAAEAYNRFEKVRDPSHFRALQTDEWLALLSAARLVTVHVEHQPKAMTFNTWCQTMAVPDATVKVLRAMLGEASPALQAFLKPRALDNAGTADVAFTLTELIAIAKKAD